MITVIDIDNKKLWQGAKVRRKQGGVIRTVFVVPENKTLFECAQEGTFNPNEHIDYNTVMLNKQLFELVNEEEL